MMLEFLVSNIPGFIVGTIAGAVAMYITTVPAWRTGVSAARVAQCTMPRCVGSVTAKRL